jgi:hypothetical protein
MDIWLGCAKPELDLGIRRCLVLFMRAEKTQLANLQRSKSSTTYVLACAHLGDNGDKTSCPTKPPNANLLRAATCDILHTRRQRSPLKPPFPLQTLPCDPSHSPGAIRDGIRRANPPTDEHPARPSHPAGGRRSRELDHSVKLPTPYLLPIAMTLTGSS